MYKYENSKTQKLYENQKIKIVFEYNDFFEFWKICDLLFWVQIKG